MTDIRAFIAVRLFDDSESVRHVMRYGWEAAARGKVETWVAGREVNNHTPPYYDYRTVRTDCYGYRPEHIVRVDEIGDLLSTHIARFGSPRRQLREVALKRRILDDHSGPGHGVFCGDAADPCMDLRTLASIWAEHQDFDQEWLL